MSTKESEKTICIDLDGTLADYSGGWDAHGKFPGKPHTDVVQGMKRLKEEGYYVGIYTTRNEELVRQWLEQYELNHLVDFVNDNPWQPEIASDKKPIAFCYIDDRAARYDGHNMDEIVNQIVNGELEPWYKRIG